MPIDAETLIDREAHRSISLWPDSLHWLSEPDPADVIRACRKAAADHDGRDVYAEPLADVAYIVTDDYNGVTESHDRIECVKQRLAALRGRREFVGLLPYYPSCKGWITCRVVGCQPPDPVYGKDEKYALTVRYASDGALACYGIPVDQTQPPRCYWD
jgi:hypothetical protein